MKKILLLLLLTVSITLLFCVCVGCDKAPNGEDVDTSGGVDGITDALDISDTPISEDNEDAERQDVKYYLPESVGFGNLAEYGIDEVFVKNMSTGIEKTFTGDEVEAIIEKVSVVSGYSPISGKGIYGYDYYIEFYSDGNLLLDLGIIRLPLSEKTDYLFSYGKYERSGRFDYKALYTFADTEQYNELLGLLNEYFEVK